MDKEQISCIKRHEWLLISLAGRRQILETVKTGLNLYEAELAELLIKQLDNGRFVPLIARREDGYLGSQIPCGFVYPDLLDGRRWRLACFSEAEHIQEIITPYEVWWMPAGARNNALEIFLELKKITAQMQLNVGILGSLALECYTGLGYSNKSSDIDLLIKDANQEQIRLFLQQAQELAACKQVRVDLEVELPNGYGIKAQELFMDTKTILAKGRYDVVLFNRVDVLSYLK